MKTLILTVGGSPEPLIKSIRHGEPDAVVFVCSEDDQVTGTKGSYTQVEDIAAKSGLAPERYRVEKVPADDPAQALAGMRTLLRKTSQAGEVVADFTGGTKSMSAGLLLAASASESVRICFVTGARVDLTRVQTGMETVQEVGGVQAQWAKVRAEDAWRTHQYGDAVRALESAGQLNPDLQRLLVFSRGFARWDEMAYADAAAQLKAVARYTGPWLASVVALERFQAEASKNSKRDEAIALLDVLGMAERRERQGLWDVSIFLRYRVLEWVEQWSLRHDHGIDTSDVGSDAPESVRRLAHDASGRLVLAMEAGWQALATLGGPLSALARETEGARRDVGQMRNASVLAHGRRPLTRADSERIRALLELVVPRFCEHALGSAKSPLPQLPRELSEVGQ